jgi:hypothetical protein
MGLRPIILALTGVINPAIEIPFDDSIVLNLDETIDYNPDYDFLGNYLQNPVNKKIINIFRHGTEHLPQVGDVLKGNTSTDIGKTRGSDFTIYNPSDSGVYEGSGGYDSNGRLHFFVLVTDDYLTPRTGVNELRYFYSNDDGTTISTPTVISMPSDNLVGGLPTGKMIENNGVLLKNIYRYSGADSGGGATDETANYLLRSTDGGANWSVITIRAKSSTNLNESDIVALDNTNLVCLIRNQDIGGFNQFRSSDNGLTWSADGNTTFGETLGPIRKPPSLRRFNINNIRIIAIYSFNDNTDKHYVVYAKASDIISSGLSGWNLNTKLILNTANTSLGYNNEVHINNSLQSIMVTYEDYSLDYTKAYYYTLPTTHYQSLITELGL